MLDLSRLREQFTDFSSYQSRHQVLSAAKLKRAIEALQSCEKSWQDYQGTLTLGKPRRLVAGFRESPAHRAPCGVRPTPVTVAATDGSQIYPDRNIEPTFYLLNISRIAFQYGTFERPIMESVPQLRYSTKDLENHFDEIVESATRDVVSAIRDEFELSELLSVARAVRIDGRPIVAMVDGTLIRWMVRGLRNPALEQRLIARYARLLEQFREEAIPLCSYVSFPGGTEVVNLLRVVLGEGDPDTESDPETSLEGLVDRKIFEKVLGPRERSAVFESASHIQREYESADRICFFYVNVPLPAGGCEVGRVEIPNWVAQDPQTLDLVHSVVMSECEKGNGYPMILSEAHEKAVVRNQEKDLFYHLVEKEMHTAGVPFSASRKSLSKRRPSV